ncbi:hypothetical protein SB690_20035, partial [Bacillus sp. SIMBA_006]
PMIGFAGRLLFNEAVVVLIGVLLYRLGPSAGVIVSIALPVAIAAVAAALFQYQHRWLPPAPGMFVCVLAGLLWSWRRLRALLRFVVRLAD